jgi:hypothetical protein
MAVREMRPRKYVNGFGRPWAVGVMITLDAGDEDSVRGRTIVLRQNLYSSIDYCASEPKQAVH